MTTDLLTLLRERSSAFVGPCSIEDARRAAHAAAAALGRPVQLSALALEGWILSVRPAPEDSERDIILVGGA
jgi:hypothetical protein